MTCMRRRRGPIPPSVTFIYVRLRVSKLGAMILLREHAIVLAIFIHYETPCNFLRS